MKKKTQKKRFVSAEQIRSEIDHYKEKAIRMQQSAEALDVRADILFRSNMADESARWNRVQANKMRASSKRIEEKRLPYLKQKLAEFMTPKLPTLDDGDASINA